jgi:hypothetical protein
MSENRTMKPVETDLRRGRKRMRENRRGGEFDWGTLCACMEI